MKSAREWIKQLKPEHRDLAFWSLEDSDTTYSNLADALFGAFDWSDTPQGDTYWNGMYKSLVAGTYHFTTEESAERMATDADYKNLDEIFKSRDFSSAKEEASIAPESICQEAQRIQGGDRQQDYGSPAKNFQDIADLWSAYLKTSLDVEVDLKARDVAHMSILMKISRNVHKPKRDNWVDMAGYAQCGGKVDEL